MWEEISKAFPFHLKKKIIKKNVGEGEKGESLSFRKTAGKTKKILLRKVEKLKGRKLDEFKSSWECNN